MIFLNQLPLTVRLNQVMQFGLGIVIERFFIFHFQF